MVTTVGQHFMYTQYRQCIIQLHTFGKQLLGEYQQQQQQQPELGFFDFICSRSVQLAEGETPV